jgi:hypothetical protein
VRVERDENGRYKFIGWYELFGNISCRYLLEELWTEETKYKAHRRVSLAH